MTVENSSPYIVDAQVTGSTRDGWLDLGACPREQSRNFHEVRDQGDLWVLRFSSGGIDAGELVVGRDDLVDSGWEVAVPAAVTERLREAGLPESAQT